MRKENKLNILVLGECFNRFTPQINALKDKCVFHFYEKRSDFLRDKTDNEYSIVIFHFRKISDKNVAFIRRCTGIFSGETIIVLCEKISKIDMCLLFRLGVRDILEQSFRKDINLKEVVERINLIHLRQKKENEFRGNSADSFLRRYLQSRKDFPVDERIDNAKEYIEKNYDTEINLETAAQVACMSKYHFCRTFKKIESVSFSNYVNHLRIKKAKKLLSGTKTSISDIAFEVGFLSLSHFTNLFKESEHISPGKYRKKALSGNFLPF